MCTLCLGVSHHFFRTAGWLALACWLLVPAAWSQNAAESGTATPADVQRLETAQETNDRIQQLMLTSSGAKGDYVLGSGDLLYIEVFDVEELTREVRISETGFISLPLVPVKVRASGLTAFQLQDKLAELLQVNGLVSNPQVTVSVKEQHGEPITVIGAVRTPMVIQAVREMNLLEVLSRAGGIAEDAGGQIIVTRGAQGVSLQNIPENTDTEGTAEGPAVETNPESMTIKIGLHDLLDTGDPQYNIALWGGDVVSVPRAGVVYAVGAVQRPGGFVMQNDRQQLTVLKVLALAGGLTSTAKQRSAVVIRQDPETAQRQVPVDLEKILARKVEDPTLQPSDILFVPNSASRQAMGRVAQAAITLASGVALVRLSN
jgi:polysaccharide export outer membrane protein